MDNTKREQQLIEKLASMDSKELALKAAKTIGMKQKQIFQHEQTIAELEQQLKQEELKSKEARESAEKAIQDSQEKINSLRQELEDERRRLTDRELEIERDIEQKMANARAQADSIVETKLTEAKKDIDLIEQERQERHNFVITENKAILNRINLLEESLSENLKSVQEMKKVLEKDVEALENKEYDVFSIEDFVQPKSIDSSDSYDSYQEEEIQAVAKELIEMGVADIFEDDFTDFAEDDEKSEQDLQNKEITTTADDADDDFDDLSYLSDFELISDDVDFEVEEEKTNDDNYVDEDDIMSFTGTFMSVAPGELAQDDSSVLDEVIDDTEDLSTDFDDLDDIFNEDSDFEQEIEDEEPKLKVPKRKERKNTARWIINK